MITSTIENLGNNKVKIRFEADAETFERGMQASYLKNKGRVNVPGFRKGHAPRKMIESMYGEAIFYDDAFDAVFPEAYEQAISEHKLDVVSRPDVDIEKIGGGQPMVFVAEVYVRPDVKLGQYKGLKVTKHEHPVTDDAVSQKMDEAREKVSRMVDVEDRAVKDGDIVSMDYLGTVDAVAFPGGTAEKQSLTIGSGQFIPGFEEQMVGMKIGEERDLKVTFPKEYHAEELAGKDANFHVKLHGIQRKELPELDDDFARDVSEFDTLAAYKADIRAKLEADAAEHAAQHFENAAVEAAVANAEVEIPEPMIERQIDAMLRDFEMRLAYQGLRMEDFLKYTGGTPEQMRAQYHEQAEQRVKTQLVLDAIRKAEGIEPTETETDAEIQKYADQGGKSIEEFKATLKPDDIEYFKDAVAVDKVVSLIKDSAVVDLCDHDHDEPKKPAKKAAKTDAETAEEPAPKKPRAKK